MRYDLVFLRRDPGQSWEEAFASRQDGIEDTGSHIRRLSAAEIETWERLVPQAVQVLGPVEVTADDVLRELQHEPTGIEMSMSAEEVSITVPYRHAGDAALEVMEKVYALARVVEDETGLEGYDIQLDEPVSDAVRSLPRVDRRAAAAERDDDAEEPAPGAPLPATTPEPGDGPASARGPQVPTAPWWQFWRR